MAARLEFLTASGHSPRPSNRHEDLFEDPAEHVPSAVVVDLYERLHSIARGLLKGERVAKAVQVTALIHGADLEVDPRSPRSSERFLSTAVRTMRRALRQHAHELSPSEAGRPKPLPRSVPELLDSGADVILSLEEALVRLGGQDELAAHVLELRFYLGVEVTEVAQALRLSPHTVRGRLEFARAWLFRELNVPPSG